MVGAFGAAPYTSVLRSWVRLAGYRESPVLRAGEGPSSLREWGRLEVEGISPSWPVGQCRRGYYNITNVIFLFCYI